MLIVASAGLMYCMHVLHDRLAAEFLKVDYLFLAVGVVGGACSDVEQTIIQVDQFSKRDQLLELLKTTGVCVHMHCIIIYLEDLLIFPLQCMKVQRQSKSICSSLSYQKEMQVHRNPSLCCSCLVLHPAFSNTVWLRHNHLRGCMYTVNAQIR